MTNTPHWRLSDKVVIDAVGREVARVSDGFFIYERGSDVTAPAPILSQAEVDSNARLIASAPVLLDALKEARWSLMDHAVETIAQVEAAIAAAEGATEAVRS